MKVVARRTYYEEDLYRFDNRLYSLEERPTRKDAILVYKKGDFVGYEFQIKEFCCNRGRQRIELEGRWSNSADRVVPGAFFYLDGDDDRIQYCPFCGEKIEIIHN